VEVDENGDEFKRPALDWSDYFHKNPEATPINTFAAMKSGMKSLDSTGRCGPVSNQKAQKLMVCM